MLLVGSTCNSGLALICAPADFSKSPQGYPHRLSCLTGYGACFVFSSCTAEHSTLDLRPTKRSPEVALWPWVRASLPNSSLRKATAGPENTHLTRCPSCLGSEDGQFIKYCTVLYALRANVRLGEMLRIRHSSQTLSLDCIVLCLCLGPLSWALIKTMSTMLVAARLKIDQ